MTKGQQPAAAAAMLAAVLFGSAFQSGAPQSQEAQAAQGAQQAQQSQQPQSQERPPELQRFFLENGVSIDLGLNWKPSGAGDAAPPAGLGPYAPPFRFNQILFLTNEHQYTLLQLATSDNPLIGHDAYWLDTQMHS